jgi:hypothetical protein
LTSIGSLIVHVIVRASGLIDDKKFALEAYHICSQIGSDYPYSCIGAVQVLLSHLKLQTIREYTKPARASIHKIA